MYVAPCRARSPLHRKGCGRGTRSRVRGYCRGEHGLVYETPLAADCRYLFQIVGDLSLQSGLLLKHDLIQLSVEEGRGFTWLPAISGFLILRTISRPRDEFTTIQGRDVLKIGDQILGLGNILGGSEFF